MTHPTPTATTSASPPPRGEGMGVGGLALALTLLATPAFAQIIPTGTPAADILLSKAITEHRVFLTCSALDPALHDLIVRNWREDITAATAILTANNVPPESIAAFTTAADPKALLPAADIPFAEVKELCATHADWQTTRALLNFTVLELKLPGAFN
jgi:hypothetical protein